ncbi:MAG: sigma-70 family RNA polymerase sigma factor [Phycisphaerae bacterium]|jgi:RNA polymerase sigma-70 factor (ECF subfamily)|nr:sigma-70 family RNA polymerase sigma factor [Phycisphaerae bacterium]
MGSIVVEESSQEDASLVAAAVGGDLEALSELLAHVGPAVEAGLSIHRRWRGLLDPSDVMQVTYLEAFLAIRSFDKRSPGHFQAWLRRLAENNLQDAIRALSRRKRSAGPPPLSVTTMASSDSREVLLATLIATSSTPSRPVRRDEAFTRLEAAIARLPADYATVIRAHDLQGASIDAVAEQLGRSVGAIHMLRARALQRLADLLHSSA